MALTRKLKQAARIAANPRRSGQVFKAKLAQRQVNQSRARAYREWFRAYEPSARNFTEQKAAIKTFTDKPLVSIILPIYNTPEPYLRECIQSVLDQSYDNWELCVADDASTTDALAVVKEFAAKNKKIKWIKSPANQHIAGASNEALKLANGEFIALLDHDDLLLPNALFESVRLINENPDADLIYSDEDKVEENKGHIEPFFKPDWSPEFLTACNYITHFAVIRRSVVDAAGGFRLGTEGAQDWDLFLRVTKITSRIYHIPKILYTWRKSPTSTAKSAHSKPYAYINQLRVLRDHVAQNQNPASVLASPYMGFWRVKYHIQNNPLVSIVIPTKDSYKFIKSCLESIIEKTTYPYFEIIVVDTGSKDPKIDELYASKLVSSSAVKIVKWGDKTFNFSGACNLGARQSKGDYLVFLNNDTEVITPEWLENLLEHAQRKEIGMVGCKLLFPSGNIQHAGVVLSEKEVAFHPFYNVSPTLDIFTNIFISNLRNCSAVTAACAMISKDKFNKVGGFDEKLRITYNDVDLSLRLLNAGYRNVYTPYAELYHYESVSVGRVSTKDRDKVELKSAQKLMKTRWGELLARDPYYNINFVASGTGYILPKASSKQLP